MPGATFEFEFGAPQAALEVVKCGLRGAGLRSAGEAEMDGGSCFGIIQVTS